jgi:hypothetical protein
VEKNVVWFSSNRFVASLHHAAERHLRSGLLVHAAPQTCSGHRLTRRLNAAACSGGRKDILHAVEWSANKKQEPDPAEKLDRVRRYDRWRTHLTSISRSVLDVSHGILAVGGAATGNEARQERENRTQRVTEDTSSIYS